MNEKAQWILAQLRDINPLNVAARTDAPISLQDSFHSLWYTHTPQAARYMLLPYFYADKVSFK